MKTPNDPTVTEDGLQKALDALLAAAQDSPMAKGDGMNISHSGTIGSDGPQGGGTGSMSDAGSLDKMMIAKMIDLNSIVVTPEAMAGFQKEDDPNADEDSEMGGYWRGFMHGYAGDDMDIGDGMSEAYMTGYMRGYKKGGAMVGMGKSLSQPTIVEEPLSKSILEDPSVQEGVDASDFMDALVRQISVALDGFQKSVGSRANESARLAHATAMALHEVGGLVKSQQVVIDELGKRLNIIERTPAPPKGATTLSGAQAMAKSMPGEAGIGGGEQLKKSEVVATLSYMNLEKGMREINGRKTSDLVTLAEAGDLVDEPTLEVVNRFLKTHPNEAERARAYH